MDAYQQGLARRLARSRMRSEPSAFLGTSEHFEQYMLAAYDMDLGHIDALYELERQEEREILRDSLERQHDFKFLDQVLTDFLRTNYYVDGHDDKPWILQELMQVESPHPGKFFEYINRNIRWTSTVWRREGLHSYTKSKCMYSCLSSTVYSAFVFYLQELVGKKFV